MRALYDSLLVGVGAAIGAVLRYWVGVWLLGRQGTFPWATLLVNVTGSFALGLFMALALGHGWSQNWRLFAAVGVCGGYTTFSTYSSDVIRLFEERRVWEGVGYCLASNVLSIGACFAGVHLARLALGRS